MSTSVPTSVPNHPGASLPEGEPRTMEKIVIYGHSNLLYWWPVWAVSFVLAGVTYFEGNRMAVVPPKTEAVTGATVTSPDREFAGTRDVLVAPAGAKLPQATNDNGTPAPANPHMTMSSSNSIGVVFAMTLVIVALVSTLTFRGLVSLVIIVGMIGVVVALAYFRVWDDILAFFGGLDIRMNAAGYLFIAVPLFVAWVFVVFVYDKQVFMVVDEGQIRYVIDVGDAAMVVPAEGATVEKKRDDVFRHWLLGFGTGDIVVKTGSGQRIELENVTNVARKLVIVNDMMRHKPVIVEQR